MAKIIEDNNDNPMTKLTLYVDLFEKTPDKQIEQWYIKAQENVEGFFDYAINKFSLLITEEIELDILIEAFKKSTKYIFLLGKDIKLNKKLMDFSKEVTKEKNIQHVKSRKTIADFFKRYIKLFEAILKNNIDYSKPRNQTLEKCEEYFHSVFSQKGAQWNNEVKKDFIRILTSSSMYQDLYSNMNSEENYFYFSNYKMKITVEKITKSIIEKIIRISYLNCRPLDETYAKYLAQQYYLDYFKKNHKTNELYLEVINYIFNSLYLEDTISNASDYKDFIRKIISEFEFLGVTKVNKKNLEKIIFESDKVDKVAKEYEHFYLEFHEEMRKRKLSINPTKKEIRIFISNNQDKIIECFKEEIVDYKNEKFTFENLINNCEKKLETIFITAYINWNENTKSLFLETIKENEYFEIFLKTISINVFPKDTEESKIQKKGKIKKKANELDKLIIDVVKRIFSLNEQRIYDVIRENTSVYVTETAEEIIGKCDEKLGPIFNEYNLIWSENVKLIFQEILSSTKFYQNLFLSNSKTYQYFLNHRIKLNIIRNIEDQIRRIILYSKLTKHPLDEETARMLIGTFYVDEHKNNLAEKETFQYLFDLISDKELAEWIIEYKKDLTDFYYRCTLKFHFWGIDPLIMYRYLLNTLLQSKQYQRLICIYPFFEENVKKEVARKEEQAIEEETNYFEEKNDVEFDIDDLPIW